MKEPIRVAVGLPSTGTITAPTTGALVGLATDAVSHGLDFALIQVNYMPTAHARNEIVRQAQSAKADYLLFVDSDMMFPPDGLRRLLAHDKDIVAALYRTRMPPHLIIGCPDIDTAAAANPFGLHEVKFFGMGFCLIRMSVFEKVPPPWFQFPTNGCAEDAFFCHTAHAAGFRLWADLNLSYRVAHIGTMALTINPPPPAPLVPNGTMLPAKPARQRSVLEL